MGEKEKEDEEEMRMAVTGKRETAKTQRTKRLFAALRNREPKTEEEGSSNSNSGMDLEQIDGTQMENRLILHLMLGDCAQDLLRGGERAQGEKSEDFIFVAW